MAPKIVFHHLVLSRSTRIFWALEELGLDYTVKVHHRNASFRAPDELKKINPLGSVCPLINASRSTDRQAPLVEVDGEVLHESAYIITRLLALPTSSSDVETTPSNDSQYWATFAEGTLMLWMVAGTIIKGTTKGFAGAALEGNEQGKQAVDGYAGWVQSAMLTPASQSHLDYIDNYLSSHDYFSGTEKPGVADFMFLFPFFTMIPQAIEQGEGLTETSRGKLRIGNGLRSWWKRVEARPALKRALRRQQDEEEASKSKL